MLVLKLFDFLFFLDVVVEEFIMVLLRLDFEFVVLDGEFLVLVL